MQQLIKKRALTVVLTVGMLCSAVGYAYPVVAAQAVEGNIIRIHVLAHNDTPEEQAVKLSVRDSVLKHVGELVEGAENSEEAARVIESSLVSIQLAAENELSSQGFGHGVIVQWGRFIFPTRVYGSTALPAGSYQALNIVIGEGRGKNWWCIMYPPLCYVEGVVHKGHEVSYQFAILNVLRNLWHKIIS